MGEKSKTGSSYSRAGQHVPHAVTKVPSSVREKSSKRREGRSGKNGILPIVINVPKDSGNGSTSGLEIWYLVVTITVSILVSGGLTVCIAPTMLEGQKSHINKVEEKIEKLDRQQRKINSRVTKIEAQRENEK